MGFLGLLEGIRSPFLNTIFGLITQLGEETVAIVILCAIFWCISKRTAYVIGISYFLSGLTVQGMKIIFRIDRPWIIDPAMKPVPSALEHATGYSFPSGHTQSATALFGSLGTQVKQKPLKAVLFILPVLVAFSRMYLGVHTLLDTGVSLVISFLLILLTVLFFKGETVEKVRELIIASVMVLFAVVVIVIAAILYSNGTIEHNYITDCLKAAGAGIGFAAGMYIERVYIDFSVKAKNLLWQVIKFVLGFIGVLAIKEGLKLIIGTGLFVDTVRYFLMIMWVAVFFPLLIKKFFESPDRKAG